MEHMERRFNLVIGHHIYYDGTITTVYPNALSGLHRAQPHHLVYPNSPANTRGNQERPKKKAAALCNPLNTVSSPPLLCHRIDL